MPKTMYWLNTAGTPQPTDLSSDAVHYDFWFSDAGHTVQCTVAAGQPASGDTVFMDGGEFDTATTPISWSGVTIYGSLGVAGGSLSLDATCNIGVGATLIDQGGAAVLNCFAVWLGDMSISGFAAMIVDIGNMVLSSASITISSGAVNVKLVNSQVVNYTDVTISLVGTLDMSGIGAFGLFGVFSYSGATLFLPPGQITLLNNTANAQGVRAATTTNPGIANVRNGTTYSIYGHTYTGTMSAGGGSHGHVIGG